MQQIIKYRKWLVLPVLMLAAALFIAQRAKHKYPTPADPGMDIVVVVNTSTGEIGNVIHDDDPFGGVEPDDPVQPEKPKDDPQVESPYKLKVTGYEVLRVGPETVIGTPGDYVILVNGEGFFEAERAPVVHLGENITLRDVYVDQKGTVLYAVLPVATADQIQTMEIKRLSVQNPGGRNCDPNHWMGIDIDHAALLQAIANAKKSTFREDHYFIQYVK